MKTEIPWSGSAAFILLAVPNITGVPPAPSSPALTSCPQKRVVGATFALRVPIPSRFGGKYDPDSRPSSTPILLEPGERRRLLKPAKPKSTSEPKPRPPKNASPPRVKKIPEEQREHEGPRQLQPEHKEASRRAAKDWRESAKELGLCRDCRKQAIPKQTRCEACAEKHRVSRRKNDAKRRTAARGNPARVPEGTTGQTIQPDQNGV